jgi:hypothetical protein
MGVTYSIAAFFALSGSATFGYLVSALLTSSKIRDLELAYQKLSQAIRTFLEGCPTCECGMLILSDDDICRMRKTLQEADALASIWTIEDYRR